MYATRTYFVHQEIQRKTFCVENEGEDRVYSEISILNGSKF